MNNGPGSRTFDLVVIGFGGAGAAAALRAAELSGSVVILEKQPAARHTPSTRMSGGHIMVVADIEQAAVYLGRCAGGMIPEAVTQAWAERAHRLVGWLDGLGLDLRLRRAYGAEHPDFPGADGVSAFMQARRRDGTPIEFTGLSSSAEAQGAVHPRDPTLSSGSELFAALSRAVRERPGIRVVWDSPVRHLIKEHGVVKGVVTDDGEWRAERGVVLASGGYEYDAVLKQEYLKAAPMYFYANPGNTGDGVRLAMEAGADLWHMNQMIGRAIGHFVTGDGAELNVPVMLNGGGYVLLDRDGRRFVDESLQAAGRHDFYYELITYDSVRSRYPRIPCYWIFDARRLAQPLPNPLTGPTAVGLYDWSPDNSAEVARGWVVTGPSLEDVAAKCGLDPRAVTESVAAYNRACRQGGDAFGRPEQSLTPIDRPPFCCVPLYPGGPATSGGPRRDEHARVLTPFGEPVAGLFAAGELGQPVGLLYPCGGCNLSEALCFGQLAAESALSAG